MGPVASRTAMGHRRRRGAWGRPHRRGPQPPPWGLVGGGRPNRNGPPPLPLGPRPWGARGGGRGPGRLETGWGYTLGRGIGRIEHKKPTDHTKPQLSLTKQTPNRLNILSNPLKTSQKQQLLQTTDLNHHHYY